MEGLAFAAEEVLIARLLANVTIGRQRLEKGWSWPRQVIGFVIGIRAKNSHFLLFLIKKHAIRPSCNPNAA